MLVDDNYDNNDALKRLGVRFTDAILHNLMADAPPTMLLVIKIKPGGVCGLWGWFTSTAQPGSRVVIKT